MLVRRELNPTAPEKDPEAANAIKKRTTALIRLYYGCVDLQSNLHTRLQIGQ